MIATVQPSFAVYSRRMAYLTWKLDGVLSSQDAARTAVKFLSQHSPNRTYRLVRMTKEPPPQLTDDDFVTVEVI